MSERIKRITYSALFAAVIFLATAVFPIPLPFGYVNVGDTFVLLAATILGPYYGAVSAGFGAALADLFLGYGIYAPATFAIKALMAVTAHGVLRALRRGNIPHAVGGVVSALCAETVMIVGYFAYETCIYGLYGALASVAGNCLQGGVAFAAFAVTERLFVKLFNVKGKFSS